MKKGENGNFAVANGEHGKRLSNSRFLGRSKHVTEDKATVAMETHVTRLETEVKELKEERNRLRDHVKNLESKNAKEGSEKEHLKAEAANFVADDKDNQVKAKEVIKNDAEDLRALLKKVKYDLGETNCELQMKMENIKDLEREKEFLQMRLYGAQREFSKAKEEADVGVKRATDMEQEIIRLKEEDQNNGMLTNDIISLRNVMDEINAENARLRADALKQFDDHKSELKMLHGNEERLQGGLENCSTENDKLKEEILELQGVLQKEKKRFRSQIWENDKQRKELSKFVCAEKEELKQEISQLKVLCQEKEEQIEDLCKENKKLKQEMSQLKVLHQEEKGEIEDFLRETEQLKKKISQLESLSQEKEERLEIFYIENKNLNKEASYLKMIHQEEVVQLKTQIENLESHNEAVKKEVSQIKALHQEEVVQLKKQIESSCTESKEKLQLKLLYQEKEEELKNQIENLYRENEELKKKLGHLEVLQQEEEKQWKSKIENFNIGNEQLKKQIESIGNEKDRIEKQKRVLQSKFEDAARVYKEKELDNDYLVQEMLRTEKKVLMDTLEEKEMKIQILSKGDDGGAFLPWSAVAVASIATFAVGVFCKKISN